MKLDPKYAINNMVQLNWSHLAAWQAGQRKKQLSRAFRAADRKKTCSMWKTSVSDAQRKRVGSCFHAGSFSGIKTCATRVTDLMRSTMWLMPTPRPQNPCNVALNVNNPPTSPLHLTQRAREEKTHHMTTIGSHSFSWTKLERKWRRPAADNASVQDFNHEEGCSHWPAPCVFEDRL